MADQNCGRCGRFRSKVQAVELCTDYERMLCAKWVCMGCCVECRSDTTRVRNRRVGDKKTSRYVLEEDVQRFVSPGKRIETLSNRAARRGAVTKIIGYDTVGQPVLSKEVWSTHAV